LIGKYTGLQDSYLSVIKALKHASIACRVRLQLEWVEATLLEDDAKKNDEEESPLADAHIEGKEGEGDGSGGDASRMTPEARDEAWRKLKTCHGVIVPGGFGQRGWEGKIVAANYCRLHQKPFLGVCLGFQAMIVEYARNVLHLSDADSTEVQPDTQHPTIIFMPEIDKTTMGGTMRLGARLTKFTHGHDDVNNDPGNVVDSTTLQLYAASNKSSSVVISERHRHRYEVNPAMVDPVHNAGLHFVGRDAETEQRMEVAELPRVSSSNTSGSGNAGHPYYVGVQFHPEFKSRPLHPSPPFHGLVLAAAGQLEDYLKMAKNK
jgi:CTP synthase